MCVCPAGASSDLTSIRSGRMGGRGGEGLGGKKSFLDGEFEDDPCPDGERGGKFPKKNPFCGFIDSMGLE